MPSGCVEDGGCSWLSQQFLSLVLWLLHSMVTLVLHLSSQARGILLHIRHLAGWRGVEVGMTFILHMAAVYFVLLLTSLSD